MVIVMALFNVSQYTRMVSLTPDYIYKMIELVFISMHYLEMVINSRFISSVYCSVPLDLSDEDATSVKDSSSSSCVSLSSLHHPIHLHQNSCFVQHAKPVHQSSEDGDTNLLWFPSPCNN